MKRQFVYSSNIENDDLIPEMMKDAQDLGLERALVRLAIDRLNGDPQIFFARIDFFRGSEQSSEPLTYDYEELVLTRFVIQANELARLLGALLRGESITVNSIGKVKCNFKESTRWSCQVKTSNTHFWYIKHDFPHISYLTQLSDLDNRNSYGLIAKKGLAPHSNRSKAIIDFLNLYNKDPFTSILNQNQFAIVIPDYRAKIQKMKIGKNKISLDLECRYIDEKDIFVQANIDGRKEIQIPAAGQRVEINSITNPKQILAVLMEKNTGEVLDYIDYTTSWTESEDSIEKEIPEDIVRSWIEGGENEHVEFKAVLDHSDDVAKTIVSFANTEGGAILVGVDKNGRIIGYGEPLEKTKTRVQDMIANKCDPPINFKAEIVDLGEKITLITIPKGEKKIYAVTNGGIYLRRGGTDTFIKPSELESRFINNNQTRNGL